MSLLFSLALRNALRNRRRSVLTALTVTLGIGLLMLGMSWIHGVLGGALNNAAEIAGHVRIVKPAFVQKEQLSPLYENLAETDPVVKAAAAVPGVKGAYVRLSMPVTLSAGDELGENFTLLQGADAGWFTDVMGLNEHLVEGRMLEGDKEIVLGKVAAEQAHAAVGQKVVVLGQTQDGALSPAKLTVVGIVDMGNAGQNRISYVTLEKARYLADIPQGGIEVLVYGETPQDAGPLAAALRADPAFADLTVQAWSERSPFNGMIAFSNVISFLAVALIVFITALGVLNTMLMSVMERTAEIGVLRAMGQRTWETVLMFVIEAVGISAVGGVVGAAVGGAVAYLWLERVGINLGRAIKGFPSEIPVNSVMRGDITWEHVAWGVGLGLVMAILGSVVPATRAALIQPIEAMRTRK